MAYYYIEVYRPCYPETGIGFNVHRNPKGWPNVDCLSPSASVFYSVKANTQEEALAAVLEDPSRYRGLRGR